MCDVTYQPACESFSLASFSISAGSESVNQNCGALKADDQQLTSIEDGIFPIICSPKRLPLVQSPLWRDSGFDIRIVGVRHVEVKYFLLLFLMANWNAKKIIARSEVGASEIMSLYDLCMPLGFVRSIVDTFSDVTLSFVRKSTQETSSREIMGSRA